MIYLGNGMYSESGSNNQLMHYGVLGMRWGVRKASEQNTIHNNWRNGMAFDKIRKMYKDGKISKDVYKRAKKRMEAQAKDYAEQQKLNISKMTRQYMSMSKKERQKFKEKYGTRNSFYEKALSKNNKKTPGYKNAYTKAQRNYDVANAIGSIPGAAGAIGGYMLGGPSGAFAGGAIGGAIGGGIAGGVGAASVKKYQKDVKDPELNKRINQYIK